MPADGSSAGIDKEWTHVRLQGKFIVDAEVAKGDDIRPAIERLLARPDAAYVHAHFAGRGCFAARIDRI